MEKDIFNTDKNKLSYGRGYVYSLQYHLVWCTKYRIGLITGESIGQVASQTMQSLYCTNEVCVMPVFRPVIGFDKQEIIDLSEKIGTYETSIQPFEDCCTIFVAKHPVTKPNLNIIKNDEKHLDDCIEEMLKTAIDTVERIEIK